MPDRTRRRRKLRIALVIVMIGVATMTNFGKKYFFASAEAAGAGGGATAPRVFLGQPTVGRFVVTRVEQTPPRHESHISGLFIVPYRLTLEVKETLPPVKQKSFVMSGTKGQGAEAGALGLEDWLPINVGAELVLAFDVLSIESAKQVVYLSSGANVEPVWQSAKRFYESLKVGRGLDPARVADALEKVPLPRATFFQLVFDYDKTVYQNAAVVRALARYVANNQIPALDRRTTVAHYLSPPNPQEPQLLRDLAHGMLQLVLDLVAARQGPSASVVLQRVYGFCFDAKSNEPHVKRPDVSEEQRSRLEDIIESPEVALNATVARSLRNWLSSQ
jgi:hypothetical protein